MAAMLAYPRWTVEHYLEMERMSPVRHEFVDGHVYALAGGTGAHSRIAVRTTALLVTRLSQPCEVFNSDMQVRITEDVYLYPDVSVSCASADLHNTVRHLAGVRLVVEVLSESTAAYDRGDKFALYQQHAALQDYVLIETRWQMVEVRSRQADGAWLTRRYGSEDLVRLPSLDLTLPVADVYQGIDLPATEPAG